MAKKKQASLVAAGTCLAVALRPTLYVGCRVIAVLRQGPILEGVDSFGSKAPSIEEVARGRILRVPSGLRLDTGPYRVVLEDPLERRPWLSILGNHPRVPRGTKCPHLGYYWDDIRKGLLTVWAARAGRDPDAVVLQQRAREDRAKARAQGLDTRTYRLREDARRIVQWWRDGDYDNLKDVILEARDILPKLAKPLPREMTAVQHVLEAARKELMDLIREDPTMAEGDKDLL
jgi:hypothetical protein